MSKSESQIFAEELLKQKDMYVNAKNSGSRYASLVLLVSSAMEKAAQLYLSDEGLKKKLFVIEALGIFLDAVDLPYVEGDKEKALKGVGKLAIPTIIESLWVFVDKDVSSLVS